MGTARTRANNKWNAKAYDRINFVVPKGEKEQIAQAAAEAGESTNAYILRAVRDRMKSEE